MKRNETRESPPGLAEWMRLRMNDGQRFLVLCVAAGLLCGLAAVLFHLAIHHLFDAVWAFAVRSGPGEFVMVMLAAPTLGGLIAGLGVKYLAPDAAGSGIPQTKAAYYNHGGKISSRSGFWRFVLGALYVGLGNSLGREGPTVHICTSITSRIGRWAFRDASRVQAMAPVGMAAGIAAAFNAPLSALTFVFEELLDNFSMKALGGMVVAVVVAAAVSRTILGEDPVIAARIAEDYPTSWWMLVAVPMGLLAGLIGHGFVKGILNLRAFVRRWGRVPVWLRPGMGGFGCGVLGLLGYEVTAALGDARNSVFSIGYDSLEAAFTDRLSLQVIAVLLILKFAAVVLNYGTGGSGGLFSPTLFLGGLLGALVGMGFSGLHHFGDWVPSFPGDGKVIGGCVLLGMGAMFASVVRCPFTSLIIIFEMTGNYSLILPLMAGNIIAWQLAKRWQPISIYNALLLQDGVTLRRMPAYRGAQDYRQLPVETIMTRDAFTLESEETVAAAISRIRDANAIYHGYPVLSAEGNLLGVITYHELRENAASTRVLDLLDGQDLLMVGVDTSIHDAANLMIERDFQQVPVVAVDAPDRLVGWLTLNDIARQQNAVEL